MAAIDEDETEPAHGRMTLMEHLTELRRRIIICAIAIVVGAIIGFLLYSRILHFLVHPYAEVTKNRPPCGPKGCNLIATEPLAPFIVRLKVSTYAGFVIALPVVLWQLWRFITPGLNPKEKKYAIPFILSSIVLFLMGGAVAWLTFPKALNFLVKIGGGDIGTFFAADKYLTFVSPDDRGVRCVVRVPRGAGVPDAGQGPEDEHTAQVPSSRHRRDRRLRGGHHPEPGPVLPVLHGRADGPVLRRFDRDRKDLEAMSSPGARQRRRRQQYQTLGRVAELVTAVGAAVAIVAGTALMIWLLRPGGLADRQPRSSWLVGIVLIASAVLTFEILRPKSPVKKLSRQVALGGFGIIVVGAVLAGVFWPGGIVRHTPTAQSFPTVPTANPPVTSAGRAVTTIPGDHVARARRRPPARPADDGPGSTNTTTRTSHDERQARHRSVRARDHGRPPGGLRGPTTLPARRLPAARARRPRRRGLGARRRADGVGQDARRRVRGRAWRCTRAARRSTRRR